MIITKHKPDLMGNGALCWGIASSPQSIINNKQDDKKHTQNKLSKKIK